MKKKSTKILMLLAFLFFLGAKNASAADYTIYYDATTLIDAIPSMNSSYEFGDRMTCTVYPSGTPNTTNPLASEIEGDLIGNNIYKFTFSATGKPWTVAFTGYWKYKQTGDVTAIPSSSNTIVNGGSLSTSVYNGSGGTRSGQVNESNRVVNFFNNAIYSYNTTFGRPVDYVFSAPGSVYAYNLSYNVGTDLSWGNQAGIDIVNDICYTQLSSASNSNPSIFLLNSSVDLKQVTATCSNTSYNVTTRLIINYTITYKAPGDSEAKTVTGNSEYYTAIGTSYYGATSTPTIQLLKTGTYTLQAVMPTNQNATWVGESPVLTVHVGDIALIDQETLTWSNQETTLTLASLGSESEYTADDFKFTITPSQSIVSTTQPSTRPEDFLYWDWAQMIGIENSGQKVDGYYYTPEFKLSIDDNNELIATGYIPVSGEYTLSLECANANDDTIIVNSPVTLTVIPNLDLRYPEAYDIENADGTTTNVPANDILSLEGNKVGEDGQTLTFPYFAGDANEAATDMSNVILYTPGNYLDQIRYFVSTTGDENIDDPTSIAWKTSSNHSIDLSELSEKQPKVYLYLMFTKNGVSSEVRRIIVTYTTSAVPTGVEVIGEEFGEAVYYNLQGVKVVNPENGIFVKVVGGKATKVVK